MLMVYYVFPLNILSKNVLRLFAYVAIKIAYIVIFCSILFTISYLQKLKLCILPAYFISAFYRCILSAKKAETAISSFSAFYNQKLSKPHL